ncbi:hypothetical protein DENSPDRAFT_825004 [Dentipellis sp. KUC8613]|nr:hypothetical protein DENSPDRAFT_825004 [Dentipellis sp. KUC8613]
MSSRSLWASCSRRAPLPSSRRAFASEAPRPKKPSRAALQTAVVLNRSPIITRTPSLFERAYYNYQARIQRALHNPFPYEFYFKPGSPLEAKFSIEERRRDRKAFGPGFGADSEDARSTLTAEDLKKFGQEEEENTVSRVHASDLSGNVKSLDRNGQRNLYLLVQQKKDGKDAWVFPQGDVNAGELLHEAAERRLLSQCGDAMDTWIVSRNPIGLHEILPPTPPTDPATCIFFFKAHIMAGQVHPDGKSVADFAWLTKQEIEERVAPDYWHSVKDILSDF